jgi:hypothetical protein
VFAGSWVGVIVDVLVGGTTVFVDGTDVFVGGTGVSVAGIGVLVSGIGVSVGGTGVSVAGAGVSVAGLSANEVWTELTTTSETIRTVEVRIVISKRGITYPRGWGPSTQELRSPAVVWSDARLLTGRVGRLQAVIGKSR